MADVVTREELENAKLDCATLGNVVNGVGANPVISRLGASIPQLPGLTASILAARVGHLTSMAALTTTALIDIAAARTAFLASVTPLEESATASKALAEGYAITAGVDAGLAAGYRAGAQNFYNLTVLIGAAVGAFVSVVAMNAALAADPTGATYAAGKSLIVWKDEGRGNRMTIYQRVGLAAVGTYVNYASQEPSIWRYDPDAGNDANPGTKASPFQTLAKAASVCAFGDIIIGRSGAVVRERQVYAVQLIPDGVTHKSEGSPIIFNCFDKYLGAWTANAGAYYTDNILHDFGGAGVFEGSGRFYPAMMYRPGANADWKQLKWHYRNEFASDAAGIAYVQANAGHGYVEDRDGNGSSYTAGWKQGNFRYHLNLGADPSAWTWLVLQRQLPTFGKFSTVEGLLCFGQLMHNGLELPACNVRNVEVAYPRQHGCFLPGSTTENFIMRDGNPTGAGYAIHQFYGGGSVDWPRLKSALHNDMQILNWPGALVGAHGTDGVDGGGGAGFVGGLVVWNRLYAENVYTLGNGGGITVGLVFNDPVFNAIASCGGSNWNLTLNRPMITHANCKTDVGEFGNLPLFSPSAAGYTCTINDGLSVSTGNNQPIQGDLTGYLVINRHRNISFAMGFGPDLIYDTGAYLGITINDSLFQYNGGGDRHNNADGAIQNPLNYPKNFNRSHFAGYAEAMLTQTGVVIDEHTRVGGGGGLEYTGNPREPIRTLPTSSWHSIGSRVADFSWGFGGNRTAGVVASTGVWLQFAYNDRNPSFTYPAGFKVRGGFGMWPTNNKTFVYGANGGLAYADAYGYVPGTAMTAIATGIVKEFSGHLIVGANVFLGCTDGSIYKLDTATNAVTNVASPVGYRIKGGVMVDANNLMLFGYNADESGGAIYSTDAGVTWTACGASIGTAGISSGHYVNGFIALFKRGAVFCTSATVNGAFTMQYDWAAPEVESIEVDVAKKVMVVVGSNRLHSGGNPLNGVGHRAGKFTGWGTIDCSNAAPALWRYKGRARPLPGVRWVTQSHGNSYDGTVFNEYLLLGQSLAIASVQDWDDTDWAYDTQIPIANSVRSTRVQDNLGLLTAG